MTAADREIHATLESPRPKRLDLSRTPLVLVWVERYKLTAAETVTLRLALDGFRIASIAAIRGRSRNTVRNQISTLLAATGTDSLADVVIQFMRELLEATA